MEALKHLIKVFLKLAVAFFFFAFVWWFTALFFPALSFSSLLSYSQTTNKDGTKAPKKDLLPAPKNYGGLLATKGTQNEYSNVYTAGEPFNGYNTNNKDYSYSTANYVVYTSTGTAIIKGQPSSQVVKAPSQTTPTDTRTQAQVQRSTYIRNLSIYEGGRMYTGLSFIGEARAEFFKEGKFPIVILDAQGKVVGVSAAVATTKWTVPGWVRFETKITYNLPNNTPCTMLFEEALTQGEKATRAPVRIPLAVKCN